MDQIIKTQTDLQEDMNQITRYARDMRMVLVGGLLVFIGSAFGWDKILGLLSSLLIPVG